MLSAISDIPIVYVEKSKVFELSNQRTDSVVCDFICPQIIFCLIIVI